MLARARSHSWKTEGERDALIEQISAIRNLDAEDVAWLVVDLDDELRIRGKSLLGRFTYEEAQHALFPFLVARNDHIRRLAIDSLAAHAGPSFLDRLPELLGHSDAALVHVSLEWL
ncbi:MAG TPA: HEAT repeat domain-containing protein, partial [Thermoanaerobaculia bacterium]